MKDYNLMSMVEVAIYLQSQPNVEKTTFLDLYNKVAELKGFSEEEKREHIAQFYTDVTACGDFVYCGEELWDLKKNQKLEAMDSEFYNEHIADTSDEEEEEEEEKKPKARKRSKANQAKINEALGREEEELDNASSEDEGYENEPYEDDYAEDDYEEVDIYQKDFDYDPDDDSSSDEDDSEEEKYNAIMDDYEDLYDD